MSMKIRNVPPLGREPGGPQALDAHHEGVARPAAFRRTLSDLSQTEHASQLSDLAARIDEQGERLVKRADINEFEKYRALVRSFLDEVVSNGYEFSRENSLEARGRHRFFATVKTVNKTLDEMAKDLLEQQADNLSLLGQVDEIRGLIVDMML